jgi:hypothetical protein
LINQIAASFTWHFFKLGLLMANTIVRVYDSFFNAERVRNELLAAGFSSDDVRFDVKEDEAGPVDGNFIVGSGASGDAVS